MSASAEAEVVDLLSSLIRFDTSNPGGAERGAAEWAAEKLAEVGHTVQIVEAAPGRASLVCRIAGSGTAAPLLVHGHLDVVPADPAGWAQHPFAGEVVDDWVWGRGAVDMKDQVAMMLALVREWSRTGRQPSRDIVLALVADEEAGGRAGSHFLVDHHRDLIGDCRQAIGEVGGFSVSLDEQHRVYLIQTAEKGLAWLRARAVGQGGHGSMIHDDNAVRRLARALTALDSVPAAVVITEPMVVLAQRIGEVLGIEVDAHDPQTWLPRLGAAARMVGAGLRNTVNPTGLEGGGVTNTVPASAQARLDVRWIPGSEDWLSAVIDRLGPEVVVETVVEAPAVAARTTSSLVDAMGAALLVEDPGAVPAPYLMSAGTDAKAFARLGIECYGFAPLRLPASLDFTALFHGVDERVPGSALRFGVRVLDRLLRSAWE